MIFWLGASLVATLAIARWDFATGYLVGLLLLLVAWRIGGLHGLNWVTYPLTGAFVCLVAQYFDTARRNLGVGDESRGWTAAKLTVAGWHLTFFRIYIGLDFVPHFTEKLFAGAEPHMDDVKAFAELGVPSPGFFVWLAGLCELGAAVGIGLSILTRLAAPCAALYLFVATILGQHFKLGLISANPGGGWEYPVMWMVLLLSFIYAGAGPFSIDGAALRRKRVPDWLLVLMVRRAN